MNCVLFAKMDQVFSKENKTFKKYWKIGKKYWKSQGFLSVQKSGNHETTTHFPSVPLPFDRRMVIFLFQVITWNPLTTKVMRKENLVHSR